MKTDKKRRAQLRTFRKMLRLRQSELAALAGVSPETIARYERYKRMSHDTDARIAGAIFRMIAKKNPEAVKQAAQPVLEAAEKWEKILSVEPGSEAALELEKVSGKSLAELKTRAETMAGFLRRGVNIPLSLVE
jgi:transcriptional regulator with XRE-family HTH domain